MVTSPVSVAAYGWIDERLNDQSKMLNAHAVMLDHFHWSIAPITEDNAPPVPLLRTAIR